MRFQTLADGTNRMPILNQFGNPSFESTDAVFATYDSLVSGSVRGYGASRIIARNYVRNSGFRYDLSYWLNAGSNATLSRGGDGPGSPWLSPYYVRTQGASAGWPTVAQVFTGIQPNTDYNLRLWMRTQSTTFAVLVRAYSGSAYTETKLTFAAASIWYQYTVKFSTGNVPTDSIQIILVTSATGGTTPIGSYFDLSNVLLQPDAYGVGLNTGEWFDEWKVLIPGSTTAWNGTCVASTAVAPVGANSENMGTYLPQYQCLTSSQALDVSDPLYAKYGRRLWYRFYNNTSSYATGNNIIYSTAIPSGTAIAGQKYRAVVTYRSRSRLYMGFGGGQQWTPTPSETNLNTMVLDYTATATTSDLNVTLYLPNIPVNYDPTQGEILGVIVYKVGASDTFIDYWDGSFPSDIDHVYSWIGGGPPVSGYARQSVNQTGPATKPLGLGVSGATVTAVSDAVLGLRSAKVVCAGSAYMWFGLDPNTAGSFMISFWAKADRASITLTGATIGTTNGAVDEGETTGDRVTLTTSWQRYYVPLDSYGDQGSQAWYPALAVDSTTGYAPAGTTVWIDGMTITATRKRPYPYVDGSRPGGQWMGPADAARSYLWPRADSLT